MTALRNLWESLVGRIQQLTGQAPVATPQRPAPEKPPGVKPDDPTAKPYSNKPDKSTGLP